MSKPYFRPRQLPAGAVKGLSHRGSDVHRENTLAAFASAAALGFRYFETDVRTTKDGQLVCFHDETLDRVSTGTGPLSAHTWAELAAVRVGGERLLRFEDLLTRFPEHHLNVDLKDEAGAQLLAELLHRHRAEHRVLVGSFSDANRFRFFRGQPRLRKQVASSAGKSCLIALWAASRAGRSRAALRFGRWFCRRYLIDAVQVPVTEYRIRVTDRRFVDYCHALGLEVHVWTINDPAQMRELIELGVDGLVSDDGPALAHVLDRRGHWPQ